MTKRGPGGKFLKKEASQPGEIEKVSPVTKFTLSDRFHRTEPREIETDLVESELEVFKLRMRNQYAGEFGFDPGSVRID